VFVLISDKGSPAEIMEIQEWLKHNRTPPAKVFEKLNQTLHTRKRFIKENAEMSEIITAWPRLFDIDGAVSRTF
jgi:hypothetical protein